MTDYSYEELADMHYCYGFADGKTSEAAKIYAEKYPDRDHPDDSVFLKIDSQLRRGGCLTEEENSSPKMADAEVKRKGRPKKKEPDVVVETKRSNNTVSNGDDGTPPAKRGRGRPAKGAVNPIKPVSTGRGRGRPPKAKAKASPHKTIKKKQSDDENQDDEEDEKNESSGEDLEEE